MINLPILGNVTSPVGVSLPKDHQVFQRNGSNQATVTITGTYTGSGGTITSVKARANVVNGGTAVGWTVVDAAPSSQHYSGSLTLNQGFYSIDVQPFVGSTGLEIQTIPRVGVGEIFIVGGQSLTGCYNQSVNKSSDARSVMTDGNVWLPLSDQMLFCAAGGFGSPWPEFADQLVAYLGIPVAVLNTSCGGTTVADWQPTAGSNGFFPQNYYLTKIRPAVQAFPANGFRCFLWGQGETDTQQGTSTANYQGTAGVNGLRNIISQLRTDAGWTVPVGINTESSNSQDTTNSTIATAQNNVQADANNFAAANMDLYVSSTYRWLGGPHLTTAGQTQWATLDVAAVKAHFGW